MYFGFLLWILAFLAFQAQNTFHCLTRSSLPHSSYLNPNDPTFLVAFSHIRKVAEEFGQFSGECLISALEGYWSIL